MVNKANKKLLNDLSTYIKEKLRDQQAELLVEFSQQYYQSFVFEDVDKISIEDLYGAVLSHWNLALNFSSEYKIKVYNPNIDACAPYNLRRYVIDVRKRKTQEEILDKGDYEFPIVNPHHSCHPHKFGYFVKKTNVEQFWENVVRVDMNSGAIESFGFGVGYVLVKS